MPSPPDDIDISENIFSLFQEASLAPAQCELSFSPNEDSLQNSHPLYWNGGAFVAQWIANPLRDLQGFLCRELESRIGALAWRRALKPEITFWTDYR
ncbi:hypothetical protein PoB_000424200 [Plakobranchus ocellatus]|uniref:Uncharacterized protein n=1 Tax=Plakobranchus ocellatus TaxID=259542 RepID=A0AAV3Y6K7_9GAST|nr:hypothetical protein PoB_000424200 [Plakobranchus ocellatus]